MPLPYSSNRTVSAELVRRQLSNSLLSVFFASGLLIAIGGFLLQIAGEASAAAVRADASSIQSQALLGSIYLLASILLIRSPNASAILVRGWPILVLPFLALVSAAWSPDPFLTLRRGLAFLGTVLFGLSLASRFTSKDGLSLITQTLSVSMVLSIVWVIALPAQGIHQATESPTFAGVWRGIFPSRNILGYYAGFAIAFLIIHGRSAFKNWLLRGASLIASFACLIETSSGSGFLAAFSLVALFYSMSLLGRISPKNQMPMFALYLFVVVISAIFLDEIVAVILDILGKDPDFTGRTPYWHYLTELIRQDLPIFGLGYYAGFALIIRPEIYSATGIDAVHTHNGYLDVIVAFGYVGLAVCIFVFVWLEWRAIRLVLLQAAGPHILNAFPFAIITFVICNNVIDPSFIAPNHLVTVLVAWLIPRLVGLEGYGRVL